MYKYTLFTSEILLNSINNTKFSLNKGKGEEVFNRILIDIVVKTINSLHNNNIIRLTEEIKERQLFGIKLFAIKKYLIELIHIPSEPMGWFEKYLLAQLNVGSPCYLFKFLSYVLFKLINEDKSYYPCKKIMFILLTNHISNLFTWKFDNKKRNEVEIFQQEFQIENYNNLSRNNIGIYNLLISEKKFKSKLHSKLVMMEQND